MEFRRDKDILRFLGIAVLLIITGILIWGAQRWPTLSNAIGDDLMLGDQTGFMSSMADAAAISAKGMGVDYATNFKRFIVGGSLGSGVDAAGAQFGKGGDLLPEAGFAFQVSAMAGVNLGWACDEKCFADRIRIYINGMSLNTSGDPFSGSLTNVGAHLQLRVFRGINAKVIRWGGIDITSGYELMEYALLLSKDLPVATNSGDADLTWNATGSYTISANTTSIPIEVSTNLRVLMFTAFAGAGLDLTQGGADSEIKLQGPISASAMGQEGELGSARISYAGSGTPSAQVPRFFAGLQVSALPVKLYGQINVGLNNSFGGHLGLRFAM